SPTICGDGRVDSLRNKEWVLFDSEGRPLVPSQGRLRSTNCNARLIVDAGGRVGVVDAAMRWIVPPRFDAVTPLPGRDSRMLAKIDGKNGVIGPDGGWIIAPVY